MKYDIMFLITRLNGKITDVTAIDDMYTECQITLCSEFLTDEDVLRFYSHMSKETEKSILITDKDVKVLVRMLRLSNDVKIRGKANWMNMYTNEMGNSCRDFQDFMFEKLGIYLEDNFLSEKNREIIKKKKDSLGKCDKSRFFPSKNVKG